jgi:hypothetical protein
MLVNLQPAQTGSAMSSYCQKRRAEARRWQSARQKLRNGRSNLDTVLAVFDILSTPKTMHARLDFSNLHFGNFILLHMPPLIDPLCRLGCQET